MFVQLGCTAFAQIYHFHIWIFKKVEKKPPQFQIAVQHLLEYTCIFVGGTQSVDGHISYNGITSATVARPESHLRELTSRNNVDIKFDEFQSGQVWVPASYSKFCLMIVYCEITAYNIRKG